MSRLTAGLLLLLIVHGASAQTPLDPLRALRSPDPAQRWLAAEMLAAEAPGNHLAAVPALAKALRDDDPDVRRQAAVSLRAYRFRAEPSVPALILALEDADAGVRRRAADALAAVGAGAEEAVDALTIALNDRDADVRLSAVNALASVGDEAVSAVVAVAGLTADKVASIRRAAASAVARIAKTTVPADARKAATLLAGALKDNDVEVRNQSLNAIAVLGPRADPARDVIGELSRSADIEVRRRANEVLVGMGSIAVPDLERNLIHRDGEICAEALMALTRLGLRSRSAIPSLKGLCDDRDDVIRRSALAALRAAQPPLEDVVDVLLRAAEGKDRDERLLAIAMLGDVAAGPHADAGRKAVEFLAGQPAHDDAGLRLTIIESLGRARWGEITLRTRLQVALDDGDYDVRQFAALGLSRLNRLPKTDTNTDLLVAGLDKVPPGGAGYNPDGVSALVALGDAALVVDAIDHQNASVRAGVAEVLRRWGADPSPVLKPLQSALLSSREVERNRAFAALKAMRAEPPKVAGLLAEAVRSRDPDLSSWAAASLEGLGEAGLPLLDLMIRAAGHPHNGTRISGIRALGSTAATLRTWDDFKPDLVLTLNNALADDDPAVRREAFNAWLEIVADRRPCRKPISDVSLSVWLLMSSYSPEDAAFRNAAARILNAVSPDYPIRRPEQAKRPTDRACWAAVLALRGRASRDSVPMLRRALRDEHPVVREQAALALAAVGREAHTAVPDLVGSLTDRDPRVQSAALRALSAIGPDAVDALPALVARLRTPSSATPETVTALTALGTPAVVPLVELLESDDPRLVIAAATALGRMKAQGRSSWKDLHKAFARSGSTEVRSAVAEALIRVEPWPLESVVVLVTALHHGNPEVRRLAAERLTELTGKDGDHAATIARALRDEDPVVRRRVVTYLGRPGERGRSAAPALAAYLAQYPEDTEAAQSLALVVGWSNGVGRMMDALTGELGLEPRQALPVVANAGPDAVPLLVKALGHPSYRTRVAAARALTHEGLQAEEAVMIPPLLAAVTDKHPAVRREVVLALGRIGARPRAGRRGGESPVEPALRAALDDGDERVRRAAATQLAVVAWTHRAASAKFADRARPAVPLLLDMLRDPDDATARAAQDVLPRVGPAAFDGLKRLLKDNNPVLRRRAVEVVGSLQEDADPELRQMFVDATKDAVSRPLAGMGREGVALVIAALKDADERRRAEAASVLGGMPAADVGPNGTAALARVVADSRAVVRREAAAALFRLAEKEQPAFTSAQGSVLDVLVAMRRAVDDRDPEVRGWAARVLGTLGSRAEDEVPSLIEMLTDASRCHDGEGREMSVAGVAAEALGRVRCQASVTVAALAGCLKDADAGLRQRAAAALGRFGGDALSALKEGVKDRDPDVRIGCVRALGTMARTLPEAMRLVRAACDDADVAVKIAAENVLAELTRERP